MKVRDFRAMNIYSPVKIVEHWLEDDGSVNKKVKTRESEIIFISISHETEWDDLEIAGIWANTKNKKTYIEITVWK